MRTSNDLRRGADILLSEDNGGLADEILLEFDRVILGVTGSLDVAVLGDVEGGFHFAQVLADVVELLHRQPRVVHEEEEWRSFKPLEQLGDDGFLVRIHDPLKIG